MLNLSRDTQADVIEAFNNTSRYLDDIFNIDNPFFATMVHNIYPSELKLIKANNSDLVFSVQDFHLAVVNGKIISKIYDKREDIPPATSYGVYVSQLIRFARCCTKVEDFNMRNISITSKTAQSRISLP